MEIVGLVGFAGAVVFGLLYIVFLFKGVSLKIPVIGMAVFVLVLAAAVLLPLVGIALPGSSTAGEPPESTSAGGEPSESAPASALTSEDPALTSAPEPGEPAPTPASGEPATAPASDEPATTPAPTPAPATAEEFKRVLTGGWSTAYRDDNMLYTPGFDFSIGGELHISSGAYSNVHESPYFEMWEEECDEYGWFWAPMGHPGFYGNYSLTALGDGRFALEAAGTWDDAGPGQYTCELTYVDDNTILIDGVTFVRGSNYTLAEYARIFGFDIEF